MLAGRAMAVLELGIKESVLWLNGSGSGVPGGELELGCED